MTDVNRVLQVMVIIASALMVVVAIRDYYLAGATRTIHCAFDGDGRVNSQCIGVDIDDKSGAGCRRDESRPVAGCSRALP
jgi:hypothetical protein